MAPSIVFRRESHSGGPGHLIICDPVTLRPLSCTCAAGAHGRLCWAVVDVAATELEPHARAAWVLAAGLDETAAAARTWARVRKWAAAARELQSLRSDLALTDRGRAAIAEAVPA